MIPEETLFGRLRAYMRKHPQKDSGALAAAFVKELAPEMLVALLVRQINQFRRVDSRRTEDDVFTRRAPHARVAGVVAPTALTRAESRPTLPQLTREAFAPLLNSTFSLGGGQIVSWGKATLEQHQQRVAYLERMSIGIDRTIVRHEAAIRVIRLQNVTCLAQAQDLRTLTAFVAASTVDEAVVAVGAKA